MTDVHIGIAFLAGIVSFLSPCVFPLTPGFLAYLSGAALAGAAGPRRRTMAHALAFVLGFAVVFAAAGILLQTALVGIAYDARLWMSRIGGVIVAFFGVWLTGLVRIPLLERDIHLHVHARPGRSKYLTSALFGAAFAISWSPCIGAILGAILTLSVSNPGSAFLLMLAYALGMGLPFLLFGAFAAAAQRWVARYTMPLRYVTIAFGILLVIIGILMATQQLTQYTELPFFQALLIVQ
jgi:cytochrome c-type biogenesis protein